MLKTNCIRQPLELLPVHLTTAIHALNFLITAVLPSPGYNFLTATLKCICNDSFIDDEAVSVELGSCLLGCLMQLVSSTKANLS